MKWLKKQKWLVRIIVAGCLLPIIHLSIIVIDGFTDEKEKCSFAVVLGNKVELNGKPSPRLQTRLDKAVELYEQQIVDSIIVSGGKGIEGFEEAEVMKSYMVTQGVPAQRVLCDYKGYTTYRTAKNTLALIANPTDKIIVVSHYFHISRTKLAFRNFGMKNVQGVHSELLLEAKEPYALLREFIGFYYYLFRSYE